MQIDIDFDLFKRLTLMRRDEADSYSDVIRRLLQRSLQESKSPSDGAFEPKVENALAAYVKSPQHPNALAALGGAWFDNTHFPEGTKFRATYKGDTYEAEIKGGAWIGNDGIKRTSPSAAASAISDTNVNGWRFWLVKRPLDSDWQRMDALRQ